MCQSLSQTLWRTLEWLAAQNGELRLLLRFADCWSGQVRWARELSRLAVSKMPVWLQLPELSGDLTLAVGRKQPLAPTGWSFTSMPQQHVE